MRNLKNTFFLIMITFPKAKINLGLNVVERRADGYHNLETVFYPVPLTDALELHPMDDGLPSEVACDLKVTNIDIAGPEQDNLVVRAYKLLAADHKLPRVHVHLHKGIPTQAGMGGGSSDCAAMIRLLNDGFGLGMDNATMERYAVRLGADCPFFISGRPAYAEGIGERLHPIDLRLDGWWLGIVRPDIPVPTREAFALVKPTPTTRKCRDIVAQPVETWRGELVNDFEASVFAAHPEIGAIKQRLYSLGAVYASMSGSGSSVFGLFRSEVGLSRHFEGMFTAGMALH